MNFYKTVLPAIATTVIVGQYGWGFILNFVVMYFLVLAFFSYLEIKRNLGSKSDLMKVLGVWVVAVLLMALIHWYHDTTAREYADEIIDAVAQYKLQQGHFPESLSVVGMDELSKNEKWSMRYNYREADNYAELIYRDTYSPVLFKVYRFDISRWGQAK